MPTCASGAARRITSAAQPREDGVRVCDERLRGCALGPAAGILERLRSVPVEERRERLDLVRKQLVDEPVVEVESRVIDLAPSVGKHARPRDREAEAAESE